jgi:hypothetical protein
VTEACFSCRFWPNVEYRLTLINVLTDCDDEYGNISKNISQERLLFLEIPVMHDMPYLINISIRKMLISPHFYFRDTFVHLLEKNKQFVSLCNN